MLMYIKKSQGNCVTSAASGLLELSCPARPGTAGEKKRVAFGTGLLQDSNSVSIPQQDTFTTQHPTPGMCILILCFDKQISMYFNVLYLGEYNSVCCAGVPRGCSYF